MPALGLVMKSRRRYQEWFGSEQEQRLFSKLPVVLVSVDTQVDEVKGSTEVSNFTLGSV